MIKENYEHSKLTDIIKTAVGSSIDEKLSDAVLKQKLREVCYEVINQFVDVRLANNVKGQNPDAEGYLDSVELCDMLHISITSLWRRENDGVLKCHHIGGKKLYSKQDVQKLVESGKLAKFSRRK